MRRIRRWRAKGQRIAWQAIADPASLAPMKEALHIVSATTADAHEIAAIYGHHVIHGTASWELEPPSVEEIALRMGKTLGAGWPWLVARDPGGDIVGYAYASQFSARAGYFHTCENSIYIAHEHTGKGIGSALLAALIEASERAGFRQMVALIAGTEPASVALHERAGFVHCGLLKSVGRKHGQWLDCIYMQRALGEGDATPPNQNTAR
jgi:L-amino acid N-acyltransferase YncA